MSDSDRSITITTNLSQDTLDPARLATPEELESLRDRYQAAVVREVERLYPDTEVQIVARTGQIHTEVYAEGMDQDSVQERVSALVEQIWNRQNF